MPTIEVQTFLQESHTGVILDVRSPKEYASGHIPGAHSYPLFSDQERHEVGTVYKQKGRDKAIELGYEFVTPKIPSFIEQAQKFGTDQFYVHCWRGGMRSGSVAKLLETIGYKTFVLNKGYKAFRNFVLSQFQTPLKWINIAGFTGSAKTELLHLLKNEGHQVLDFEGLAGHKGSAFGNLSKTEQPSTEHFENLLAHHLLQFDAAKPVFVEDENRNLGRVRIPDSLIHSIQAAPMLFVERTKEERINHIVETYNNTNKEAIKRSFTNIQKRLGGQNLKDALDAVEANDAKTAVSIALSYYDKYYYRSINSRPFSRFIKIRGGNTNEIINQLVEKSNLLYD